MLECVSASVNRVMLREIMGEAKETLFTEAVTTILFEQRCEDMAEQMSIKWSNLPPIRFPKVLVSLGNTISVMMALVDAAVLVFMVVYFRTKVVTIHL